MKVYIVGNSLVKEDRSPVVLLPRLRCRFPQVTFELADPNENFIPEEGSIIIDSVVGIKHVTWFDSLDAFAQTKSVSPHDYDLGFHLRLLLKLKKISTILILGVPSNGSFSKMEREVTEALKQRLAPPNL